MPNNVFFNSASRRLGRRVASVVAALVLGAVAAWLHREPAPLAVPAEASAPADLPRASYTLRGTIVNVADGDTVTLRAPDGQRRIRLDSIDAPEAGHGRDQPGQPYAEVSRQHLASLVAGRDLTAQCYEKDQYGRELCALILPDGRSANREQVAAGYAWAYTARRGNYLRDKSLPELQRRARQAGRGLWVQPGAVEPWKWRYDCWKERRCQ